jgi:hypothetical protein
LGAGSINGAIDLGSASVGSAAEPVCHIYATSGGSISRVIVDCFITDTSGQLYFSQTNATGTPSGSEFATLGWIDFDL